MENRIIKLKNCHQIVKEVDIKSAGRRMVIKTATVQTKIETTYTFFKASKINHWFTFELDIDEAGRLLNHPSVRLHTIV